MVLELNFHHPYVISTNVSLVITATITLAIWLHYVQDFGKDYK